MWPRHYADPVRQPLSIAVAQPPCVAHDVEANAATHAATVRAAAARIVAFPELSLTGYELAAAPIATGDPRLAPIVAACAETGTIALAGAPVRDDAGHAHVAMLAIDGSGTTVAYRTIWLATSESQSFTAGAAPAVLQVDGWRLGLAICKDTSVRHHQSDTAALGIDAYVAGTLMHRHETALQNDRSSQIAATLQVWVAVASFAGPTGAGYDAAAGCSGIWAPDGAVLAQAGPAPGGIARAVLG
jgi:predicted amidohydrolase